ncbi:MAG: aspartate aminotransferase family protein [Anaerolineales bacterium]|nr:aspartate aminotransferase family protein [Anaerolineales bacterium]
MSEKSKNLEQRAKEHIIFPAVTPALVAEMGPLVFTHGEGIYLWDTKGKRYMDSMSSGVYAVLIGYGREEMAKTMYEQAKTMHYFCPYGFANQPAIDFAGKLSQILPGDLPYVFFTQDGSEAVESAFKLAKQWAYHKGFQRKYKIISRRRAYHGATMGALAATGTMAPLRQIMEPLPPGYYFAPEQYCYRCPFGLEYPNCSLQCAEAINQIIEFEGPDSVAAVIAEVVLGAGGAMVPPPEYWPRLREICDKHGVLLIDDEVVCGFGRTGKMFGIEHYGVEPDVLVMAKGISSGYMPLGATACKRFVVEDMPVFMHVHTYNNHPVSTAAGLKNVEIIERENLVENARDVGAYLLEGLRSLSHHPTVGDVRGLGLLTAVEFVRDKKTKARFDPKESFCERVMAYALDKGLILRQVEDIIEFCPPLIITKTEVDEMIKITDEAIGVVEKECGF